MYVGKVDLNLLANVAQNPGFRNPTFYSSDMFRSLRKQPLANFPAKGLRSKRRSSPCIFQVVVSLSMQDFLIIATNCTDSSTLFILYFFCRSLRYNRLTTLKDRTLNGLQNLKFL